ncbi:YraN family protein [Bacteroidetes/Chlorobi group bacterium ChocPot_Mid]|jgi:putative endonuclease|nr:MAG: YraN family protein [Bacteroidetes/Chlorobi group bacterium ChocPot_Mid]
MNETTEQSSRKKGTEGENAACEYLVSIGYSIVKRNFHFGTLGEIDIIAKDGDCIVFIEVKSKQAESNFNLLDSLTPKKQKNLKRVAEGYYYVNKLSDLECRFDIITVDFKQNPPEIEHLKTAFY